MWTEVVKFQPQIDGAAATGLENNLNKRFAKVGNKFGTGLKRVLRTSSNVAAGGGLLGSVGTGLASESLAIGGIATAVAVGLAAIGVAAAAILKTTEAAETKMKSLIESTQSTVDMADKFNTTTGQLKKLQDVGASLGFKPDAMADILGKFATALEATHKDILEHGAPTTEQSNVLKNFSGDKDVAESLFRFLRGLRLSAGDGPLTSDQQDMRNRLGKGATAKDVQRLQEEAVFGAAVPGRLVNADLDKQFGLLGGPNAARITQASDKIDKLGNLKGTLETQSGEKDFVRAASVMSPDIVTIMAQREAREASHETDQVAAYEDLKTAVKTLDTIKTVLQSGEISALSGIGNTIEAIQRWFSSGGKEASKGIIGFGAAKGGSDF